MRESDFKCNYDIYSVRARIIKKSKNEKYEYLHIIDKGVHHNRKKFI